MSKKATRQAYGEALVELGKINKDIVVLDADLTKSTKTSMFQKEFPDRHFNVWEQQQDLLLVEKFLLLLHLQCLQQVEHLSK